MAVLLWGEGWGEGERGCRTAAAAQNVFGARETEPQFLAALDKNVRAPKSLRRALARWAVMRTCAAKTPVPPCFPQPCPHNIHVRIRAPYGRPRPRGVEKMLSGTGWK